MHPKNQKKMPIELTEEQRRAYHARRKEEFAALLNEKNLQIVPILQFTPYGIIPNYIITDKDESPPNKIT